MTSNPEIKYVQGDERLLSDIASLWEDLNQHHPRLSERFRQHYIEMTFEKRKAALLKKQRKIK